MDCDYENDFIFEVNEFEEEIAPSSPLVQKIEKKSRGKKRKADFSSEEKKKLASLVEASEPIWKLENKLHKNNQAVSSLWKNIGEEMKKPVEDCKAMWRSLRDSMRYHVSGKKKTKSGSEADPSLIEGGETLEDESQEIDWEFAKSMAFLTLLSSQKRRRTYTSSDLENDSPSTSQSQAEVFTGATKSSISNYSYLNENRRLKDPLQETAEQLSKNISELIDFQKNKVAQSAPPQLKHYTMLANLDRMLQKLPEDVVEDLNFRFICQIKEQLNIYDSQ